MTDVARSIAVVGAGLAGLRASECLRDQGFDGSISLFGSEAHLPYDRPPLSKQYLAGAWEAERLFLTSADKLAGLDLEVRLGPGFRAVGLDADSKTVRFAGGLDIRADGLVLATGAVPRRLPSLDGTKGVCVLRTLEDATALRDRLRSGSRLALAGAGFIGLEVAATGRKLGVEVTVVEPLDVPLGRVLGQVGGAACETMHRAEGVSFRLGTVIDAAEAGSDGEIVCRLSDGTSLEVDTVLVGIGAVPAVDWLAGSGLAAGAGGVPVDDRLLAGPGIAVAGDIARWPLAGPNGTTEAVRVEHRTNAAEQGEWAARGLLADLGVTAKLAPEGLEPTYTVPYVWSDQFGVKIQILGLPQPDDDVLIVEGSPEERRFVALYSRSGLLRACVGFARPRHVMSLRPLIERHAPIEEAKALF